MRQNQTGIQQNQQHKKTEENEPKNKPKKHIQMQSHTHLYIQESSENKTKQQNKNGNHDIRKGPMSLGRKRPSKTKHYETRNLQRHH